jgi:hypothetical protein
VPEQQGRSRIGPWRLLDIMQASMPWRTSMLGGGLRLPEFGQPDTPSGHSEPALELPDSNIDLREQQQAVQRERSRRTLR